MVSPIADMADSKDDPIHASFNIKDLLTPARDRGGKDQHLSTPFASDHDHVQDTTFGNGDLVRLKVVDVPSDAKESVAANTSKMKQATETIRLLMREKQESMTKMGDLRSELSQVEHRYRQEQENTQTVLSDLEMEKTKTDRLKQELMQWQRKYEHESNQWERKIEMQTNNYQRELEKRERELDRQRKTKAESEKAYTEELRLKSALLEEKNQELIKLVQLEGSEQNQIKLLQHDKEVLMEKLHASDIELKEATVTLENTTKQLSQKREELMAAQEHITRINTENLKTESSDIMLLKEQLIITQKEGERFQGQIEACQQVIDEGRRENQSLVTAISTSSQIIHAQFNDSLEKWNAEVNGRLLHLEGRFSTLHEQERRLATLLQTSSTQSSENTSTTKQNLLHLEQKKAIMEQRVYMVKNELAIKEKEMAQLRLQHTEQLKKLEDQLTVSADTSAKLTNKLRTANDEVAKVRQMFQFEKTCSLQAQRVVENERLKEQEVASSTIHSLKESNTKLATQLEDTREMMLTELRAIQNKHNEHISTLVQSHNDLLREERKQGRNEAASYEDANSRAMKKQTSAHNLEMEKMRAHMENMHQELKATAQELAATKTGLETASNQLVQYAEQLKDYDMMKQNVMDFKEQMLVSQTQSEAASKHVQGAHRMAAAAKEDALKIQQECQRLRKSLDEREGQYQELSVR